MKDDYSDVFEFDHDYLAEHSDLEFYDREICWQDMPGGIEPPKGTIVRVWRLGPGIRSREFIYQ